MIFLRHCYCILLSLCVVISTTTQVVAYNTGNDAQAIVICTGLGTQTILVGADGQPVVHKAHCPKCLAHVDFTQIRPVALAPMLRSVILIEKPAYSAHKIKVATIDPQSRGPPDIF